MKTLTKAELEVMQLLWELEKGFVKDLIAKMPSPKPSYTTVSTIVRILEKKGFVGHKSYGNTHEYHPLISKETYSEFAVKEVATKFFDGSLKSLVSFFVKKEEIDVKDLDEILKQLNQNDDDPTS
ncbi:MAG: BlaI/MecI/CopY family transcriptional regulator [Bernardetiaceae bacterium]|nr:BlaI/MecI/CopY family transcriptional regulator [Bernardetiaceae bacterium]